MEYQIARKRELASELAASTDHTPLTASEVSLMTHNGPAVTWNKHELQGLLKQRFGFDEFLRGQEPVVHALLAEPPSSALAVFPTGGGKSLTYQLPALALHESGKGLTVVVSPLISLMKDQIDFLEDRGIPAARLDSSLSLQHAREVEASMRGGRLALLYVSPERFNNERFLALLHSSRVRIALFAVDEAHCISEWGHNFRPDYLKLAGTASEVEANRILGLTATATPAVVADMQRAFSIPEANTVVTGFYRSNLGMLTTPASADRRDELLVSRLEDPRRTPGPTIVYVTLQKTAERVAGILKERGREAYAYHAGLGDEERTRVQEAWMDSAAGVAVATIAFGMGIDKRDVRYIYHYNLPKSLESYSQEIGRAGRDGEDSVVEMLCCPDDIPTLQNFAHGDTPHEGAVRGLLEEILHPCDHGLMQADPPGPGATGPATESSGPRQIEFSASLYDLSNRHDIRVTVLKTILTYLELMDVLRQLTPVYDTFKLCPASGECPSETDQPARLASTVGGEPGEFLERILEHARRGPVWYTVHPSELANELGLDEDGRARIVRALDYLHSTGLGELRNSSLRHRFELLRPDAFDAEGLAARIWPRLLGRERSELHRLGQVIELAELQSCQMAYLASHFGETLGADCGHCTVCRRGAPGQMPSSGPRPLAESLSASASEQLTHELDGLRRQYPGTLAAPRQMTRFLCGLSSPRTTKDKLSKHQLFGRLGKYRFEEVLQWTTARGLTEGTRGKPEGT